MSLPLPPGTPSQQSIESFVKGLKKLKTSAILMIVVSILLILVNYIISLIFTRVAIDVFSLLEEIGRKGFNLQFILSLIREVISGLISPPVIAIALVIAVVLIIAVYGFIIPSFTFFKDYNAREFSISTTLVKIGYISSIPLGLIGIVLIVIGGLSMNLLILVLGGFIFGIAGILSLIGEIGLWIGLFKLEKTTDERIFIVAAIILILGRFISNYISPIGWILVFIASRSALNKIPLKQPPPPV